MTTERTNGGVTPDDDDGFDDIRRVLIRLILELLGSWLGRSPVTIYHANDEQMRNVLTGLIGVLESLEDQSDK